MAEPIRLSNEQLGDFKEVGNIGAGKAASRLSDLIHRKCLIHFPEVSYFTLPEIKKTFDEPDSFAVALCIKIMGDIPAIMFVITKRVYAQLIVKYMTKVPVQSAGKDLPFTAQFALKQLGEMLTKSFSEAISQFLMTKAKYAMPEIIIDTWSTALELILSRLSQPDKTQLVAHSGFYDSEKTFEGKFIYILGPDVQEAILTRINLIMQGGK